MKLSILLLGGNSSRLNNNKLKQFLEVDHIPIYMYSLIKLGKSNRIRHFILVADEKYHDKILKDCKKHNILQKISFCRPGSTRQESVFNALNYIKENNLKCRQVLIHDSSRPLIHVSDIHRLIYSSKKKENIILSSPIDDTLFEISSKTISKTINRVSTVAAGTPQIFNFNKLLEHHLSAKQSNLSFTDDASLMIYYSEKVYYQFCLYPNNKITYENDYLLVKNNLKNND